MPGRPGRSGGQNRIDPREHLLRGTFNATRHGPALAALEAAAAPWEPTRPQLAALGEDGRAFIARVRATYELSVMEGELLLEAAVVTDRLAQIRRTRKSADVKTRLALDKCEQLWLKQLTALLLAVRVPR